jgi:uncharacterized protein (TIGR02246 family)
MEKEKDMTTTATSAITAADQAAIAAVVQRIVAAWAAHDGAAFAEVFTEDGTMVLPGLYKKGREEIQAYMTAGFEGDYKGTQVTGQPLNLHVLSPESAVVISLGGVLGPGETEVGDAEAVRAHWVVVKRNGDWQLAAYMNTPRDAA